MKKKLRNSVLYLLAFLMLITLGACNDKEEQHAEGEATTYTCPMHPQIVRDEPGTCPICGMDLVPVSQPGSGEEAAITEDLAFLLEPTNSSVVSDVATTKPKQKTVQATVEMEGVITYDPRKVYTVPARVGGRIEQLYVKYNFQPISKGQKLMEIYSPELITAQQELLYLVQSAPDDKQLIEAAKQKLRLLGATDAQINRLIRTGEASYTFAIYSPYDGYVIGLNTAAPAATPGMAAAAAPAPAGGGMGGMGGGSSAGAAPAAPAAPAAGQDIQLREGMYVSTGQPLLRVVNPEQLWAEFNIPAGQVSAVAKGTAVHITFPQLPGKKLEAKVDFLQPFYQEGENFAKVRVYLPGQQRLARVGQLVSAQASYTTAPSLWVPKAAVLDIGTRSVAFKKLNGVFEPVAVTAGTTEGDQTQILEGLAQGDVIAGNAQFLVDSESFIKINK
ncbi:efflux RND transporter periplasmic adaptor subunit [Pontibacter sp. 172403-2]|uniref:efflux RND transporter periplasmic adaptor subunit n=1 Tax=Pontibacter rufus TaxID=2791028 RepID=UPI0018AFD9F1|nr:efflux RND transporter periplasmic adaptor subunit [Pontibacter sp. 172403-2]MBF9252207.1 efflux RND transporter periplasmic adaptor subunit [Pontibacter sp. 172403-2]